MAFNSKYTGAQIESKLDSVKPVDSSLSSSSTNPVQNKVVKNALDAKADKTQLKVNDIIWGGPARSNAVSPISAAMSERHSANRIAFANPAGITVEECHNYTQANQTWTVRSVSASILTKFVSNLSDDGLVWGNAVEGEYMSADDAIRVTFAARPMGVYFSPRKALIHMRTRGLTTRLKIERALGAAAENNSPTATRPVESGWVTLVDNVPVSGSSGWNDIPLIDKDTIISSFSFGGSFTQTSNTWFLRFTFSILQPASGGTVQATKNAVLNVSLFGENSWTCNSNLARNGHLYSYDENQDATFPGKVTATELVGTYNGTAAKATADASGNNIANTYATKTQVNAKYTKPSSGIPKSDLASAVQTSLGKADTALQSHQTLKTVNGQSLVGSGNVTIEAGISQESDPTVPQHVKEITQADISGWDAKGTYSKPSSGIPKSDLASAVQSSLGKADTAIQDISGKVDKVSGKGLSTNDYTTAEKNKLAGIAAGAEVNVQSDWNATSGDAMILNKPSIPVVDAELSETSTNAVQNKAVYQTLVQLSEFLNTIGDYAYYKPLTGIPKADLDASVQASLGKADTAIQDVSGKQDVISDLASIRSGAAAGATALQSHQSISHLATKTELDGKQDALSTAQLAAVNSGVTAEKVAAYDAYATAISGLNTQIGNVNSLLDAINGEVI